jgi:hypothetical protein
MSWPVEYDGDEYQPIPRSWLAHPNAYHRQNRAGPRLFAVSAAVLNSRTIRVRYIHPTDSGVLVCQTAGDHHENGIAPEALLNGTGWPHSLHPGPSDSVDTTRESEVEHFRELWGDRLDELDQDGESKRVVADGGEVTSHAE